MHRSSNSQMSELASCRQKDGPASSLSKLRPALCSAVFGIVLSLSASGSAQEQHRSPAAAPTIAITMAPPDGGGPQSWGQIAGKTTGANVREYRVVLYARTDRWYVQPWTAEPFTELEEDGDFRSGTHLGHEYAGLLIDRSFVPSPTLTDLPPIGSGVLAVARENAR